MSASHERAPPFVAADASAPPQSETGGRVPLLGDLGEIWETILRVQPRGTPSNPEEHSK